MEHQYEFIKSTLPHRKKNRIDTGVDVFDILNESLIRDKKKKYIINVKPDGRFLKLSNVFIKKTYNYINIKHIRHILYVNV